MLLAFAIGVAWLNDDPFAALFMSVPGILVCAYSLRIRYLKGIELYSDELVLLRNHAAPIQLGFAEIGYGPTVAMGLGMEPTLVIVRGKASILDHVIYCDRPSAERLVAEFARITKAPGSESATGLAVAVPPSWHPDPAGEHRLRWWDGVAWTEAVWDDPPEKPAPGR